MNDVKEQPDAKTSDFGEERRSVARETDTESSEALRKSGRQTKPVQPYEPPNAEALIGRAIPANAAETTMEDTDFSELECLSLFPARQPAAFSFWTSADAEEQRETPELTAGEMLDALRPYPALHRELCWQLTASATWTRLLGLFAIVATIIWAGTMTVFWLFNDGLFNTPNLIAASVIAVIGYLGMPLLTANVLRTYSSGDKEEAPWPPSLDTRVLGVTVRWLQTVAAEGDMSKNSVHRHTGSALLRIYRAMPCVPAHDSLVQASCQPKLPGKGGSTL